jgi:minor extracellular serine protease Vpr
MKHLLFLLAFTLHSSLNYAQTGPTNGPKLSAGTLQFLWQMEQNLADKNGTLQNYVYNQGIDNKILVNAIVKVSPEINEKEFKELRVSIGTKAGNIWTIRIPTNRVKEVAKFSGILAMEMDQPMAPELDSARRKTRVDSIHKGIGLSQAYDGKDIVIGIIDAGFDYTHPSMYDTTYGKYRVKRVWEQKATGTPPAAFGYGAEFADSTAILTKSHDVNETTHGTHVAGIAAGSGYGGLNGNNRIFRGMAYSSEMVFTAIYPSTAYWLNTGMSDMLDGINYTFQYASSVGKPAVANLSWGCPMGPRDGSSLFSQALDNLVGPGKIFVVSGGNNGQNKIHLKKTFTGNDTIVNSVVTFSTNLIKKQNQIDIWGDTGKSFCVQFSIYNSNTKLTSSEWICLDGNTRFIKLKGSLDTCFITMTGVNSEFNNKPHMLVQLFSRIPTTNRLVVSVKGQSGTVNLWQGIVIKTSGYYGTFAKSGYTWAVDGDVQMTCGDLVSTRKAIAVAAYNSKVSFTNVSGSNLSYTGALNGRIASFSSLGPTADGRVKPNIAGPGLALASSISSFDSSYFETGDGYSSIVSQSPVNGKTYSYGMAGGTSMSAPAVSGIIAILLQVNPLLTPDGLLDLFSQTVIKDVYTGQIPATGSNTWGLGKINAYRSLKKLLEPTGIKHLQAESRMLVFPNPAQGNFNIEYMGTVSELVELKISDQLGRIISADTWSISTGSNIRKLDTKNLPASIYFVELKSKTEKSGARIILN